ncbi:PO113 protein, partial [Calcarius ornatus]|nr:PO113 protein [Calcarius ornatus]NXY80483.1 PO113 protein [Glareola pratincola]
PWKYLGWTITNATIRPQKLELKTTLHTLNDVQRFMGDLQWLKPVVGLPNDLLEPL